MPASRADQVREALRKAADGGRARGAPGIERVDLHRLATSITDETAQQLRRLLK